ncbi:Alpha/Beta hydrolase protein, partial [Fusarium sp. MPI-SDFR-AT-0072]
MELKSIHHLARYAAFAYGDADGAEFRMHAPELRGRTPESRGPTFEAKGPSILSQNTRVHLGIHEEQTVVVVFSGYDAPWLYEDWFIRPSSLYGLLCYVVTDIRFSLRRIEWDDGPRNVWVHKHYLFTFNKLRDDLLKHICNLLEGTRGADRTMIQVCGHGLGGALATLCALWCAIQWKDAKITCVTLGSPMVGDKSFADEFVRRGITCHRLVIESDPFATMP